MSILYQEESCEIMGACFEVYREQGCGFLEAVYQECLEIEFLNRMISFQAHPAIALSYKGRLLKSKYTPDFICYDKIIVELKAVSCLSNEHRAQVQNYLRGAGLKLGLLVNFGHYPKLRCERIVL
jgi:GxxExxY protein